MVGAWEKGMCVGVGVGLELGAEAGAIGGETLTEDALVIAVLIFADPDDDEAAVVGDRDRRLGLVLVIDGVDLELGAQHVTFGVIALGEDTVAVVVLVVAALLRARHAAPGSPGAVRVVAVDEPVTVVVLLSVPSERSWKPSTP